MKNPFAKYNIDIIPYIINIALMAVVMALFYVGLGGAIGSILRYFFMTKTSGWFHGSIPYGTVLVNIIGSCAMGVLIGYFSKTLPHSNDFRLFTTVGILGGFTTFSAFSLDFVTLFERGEVATAVFYAVISVFGSILAVFAGLQLVRML